MIDIIIAPASAPQIVVPQPPPPPTAPRLDWIDQRILGLVREREPVKLWLVLNVAADELSPRSRAEGREARMRLLPRIRRLMRLGLLYRAGRNAVATFKPAAKSAGMRKSRRKRTVGRTASEKAVSAVMPPTPPEHEWRDFPVDSQVVRGSEQPIKSVQVDEEIQTAISSRIATEAARALARLPRGRKHWTGYIGSRRGYRDMPVVLPGGETAYLFGALRNRAVVTLDRGQLLGDWPRGPLRWTVLPTSAVRPLINPAARLLGSLKAGVVERKSEGKGRAARINGLRGGRPRTSLA